MTIPVYVSYHAEDKRLKKELYVTLSVMKRKSIISLSDRTSIAPGAETEKVVSNLLGSAKIILLLCSNSLFSSEWHWHYEIQPAKKAHTQKTSRVVPVILRPMSQTNLDELLNLQALPKDSKPITKWDDRDEAWLDVQQGLERIVDEIQQQENAL